MFKETKLMRREMSIYGVLFAVSYAVFLAYLNFRSPLGVQNVVASVSESVNSTVNVSVNRTSLVREYSMGDAANKSTIDTTTLSAPQRAQLSPANQVTPTATEAWADQSMPVQGNDRESQLVTYASLMNDPDPQIAQVARDAYAAVLLGR